MRTFAEHLMLVGVDATRLKEIALASVAVPHNISVHTRLQRAHIDARIQTIQSNEQVDWATAETMAFGSLLLEKYV